MVDLNDVFNFPGNTLTEREKCALQEAAKCEGETTTNRNIIKQNYPIEKGGMPAIIICCCE